MDEQPIIPKSNLPENSNKAVLILKNIIFVMVLVVIIIACFWISFSLGKKLLSPIRKEITMPPRLEIPSPPASLEAFAKEYGLKPKTVINQSPVKAAAAYVGNLYYKVAAGTFSHKGSASSLSSKLQASGFVTYIKKTGKSYRVQVGAFKTKALAQTLVNQLKQKGFKSFIIYEK